jgi:hypothetical protein
LPNTSGDKKIKQEEGLVNHTTLEQATMNWSNSKPSSSASWQLWAYLGCFGAVLEGVLEGVLHQEISHGGGTVLEGVLHQEISHSGTCGCTISK